MTYQCPLVPSHVSSQVSSAVPPEVCCQVCPQVSSVLCPLQYLTGGLAVASQVAARILLLCSCRTYLWDSSLTADTCKSVISYPRPSAQSGSSQLRCSLPRATQHYIQTIPKQSYAGPTREPVFYTTLSDLYPSVYLYRLEQPRFFDHATSAPRLRLTPRLRPQQPPRCR